jgi:hypothetical protein
MKRNGNFNGIDTSPGCAHTANVGYIGLVMSY